MADVVDSAQVGNTLYWIGTGLSFVGYWIGVIVWQLFSTLAYILYLLARPLFFILQPVGYLGRFLLACLWWPFELIVKFETLYIYLGIAAMVGLAGGLIVRTAYMCLYRLLRLDATTTQNLPRPRTAKQYREQKQKQKIIDEVEPALTSPVAASSDSLNMPDGNRRAQNRRSLYAQTVMEEGDSDI